MSSVRGNTDGPDEARILSLPRGGRKFEFIDRKPLSDLHVLQRETFRNKIHCGFWFCRSVVSVVSLPKCLHILHSINSMSLTQNGTLYERKRKGK